MKEINATSTSSVLSFSPVTLADKPTVDRYMQAYGENSCQHSFAALFTLQEKYGSKICEKDGFLFTLREELCREGERVYLAPMGGGDLKSAYGAILDDAAAHGCRAVFNTLTKKQVNFLRENFPGRFSCTDLRDYAEYIYQTESLSRMEGQKYAGKRKVIRRLQRAYGERLEARPLSSGSAAEILRFEEQWFCENVADHDRAALEKEKRSIKLQLDLFDLLGISGVGIYLDGDMIAFAYGVALNDACFDGIIAKADRKIPDLYKLLYWEISSLSAAPYPWFNWEEDVGVEGLRYLKTIYGPAVLMRKYLAKENDAPFAPAESDEIPVVSAISCEMDDPQVPDSFEESESFSLNI